MPRAASRITLEITGVRVERVQAISDADVAAEGVTAEAVKALWNGATRSERRACDLPVSPEMALAMAKPIDRWRIGWTLINGRESWTANPWVWVLEFRRVEQIARAA